MDFEDVKRKEIALLPTPIHKLERVSQEFGTNIYIKRDDMTGLGMGGNKVRKLEYLVQDALEKGCTALLTHGGVQTNHGMLTAAVAAKFGLKAVLMLKKFEEEEPALSGNLVLDTILAADIRFVDLVSVDKEDQEDLVNEATARVVQEYEDQGDRVYQIPTGGSSQLGSLGYVRAAGEIRDQARDLDLDFDYIFCGQGSKGTFSGLWLGAQYFDLDSEIIGVNVSEEGPNIKEDLARFINETSKTYGLGISCEDSGQLLIIEDAYGLGYAIPDRDTFSLIKKLARLEGIFVDPTYTGKVFAGMVDFIKDRGLGQEDNILFVHTGGYPGIFSQANAHFVKENMDLFY